MILPPWVSIPLAFLKRVPRQVWIGLAIVAAIWFYGHLRYNAGQASVQGKFDAYKQEVKKAVTKQIAQNAEKEAQDRAVFAQIAAQHIEDIENAKAKADRIAADLRAGNIKLRNHWRSCPAPQAAASPQGIDESARLREESAGRIIGNAAEADIWIRALQDVIRQLQDYPATNESDVLKDN